MTSDKVDLKGVIDNSLSAAKKQETYTHTNPNFSFKYDEGGEVSNIEEGGAEVLLLNFANAHNQELGGSQIQIAISPFDEDIVLTTDRIRQEIPDLQMTSEEVVTLDGTPGAGFQAEGMIEVWVVKTGFLYQMTAYRKDKEVLSTLLKTWKW